MAKTPAKKLSPSPASKTKKAPAKKTPAKKTSVGISSIENVSAAALSKLKELGLDEQLQEELEWCLGSFRADGNPIGLYEMAHRALAVFNSAQTGKNKKAPAKLIAELEKVAKVK